MSGSVRSQPSPAPHTPSIVSSVIASAAVTTPSVHVTTSAVDAVTVTADIHSASDVVSASHIGAVTTAACVDVKPKSVTSQSIAGGPYTPAVVTSAPIISQASAPPVTQAATSDDKSSDQDVQPLDLTTKKSDTSVTTTASGAGTMS